MENTAVEKRKKNNIEVTEHQAESLPATVPPVDTPQSLIRLAIEKGTSIDQLEKLMDLQERWEAKQAKKAFFDALARFQSEVPVIEKNKLVSFGNTKYKHAELSSIDEAIKVAMSNNGFTKRWEIKEEGNKINVTCLITHEGGHSEQTTLGSDPDASGGKNPIQARGSTVTYMQRYTLVCALGLTSAMEDNDTADVPPLITDDQFKAALARIDRGEQIVKDCLTKFILTKEQRDGVIDAAVTFLRQLYEAKKEALTSKEMASAGRILEGKEYNSFKKLHDQLKSK